MNRETIIEAMARAMLSDELAVKPRSDFGTVWADEMLIWLSNARAALSAIEAAGVRLVPAKETSEMMCAGEAAAAQQDVDAMKASASSVDNVYCGPVYRAMLAASPYAPRRRTMNAGEIVERLKTAEVRIWVLAAMNVLTFAVAMWALLRAGE